MAGKNDETKPVGFRLTATQLQQLDEAAERGGMRRSDFLREIVLRVLAGGGAAADLTPLLLGQKAIRNQISMAMRRLNRNLKFATAALLCDGGKTRKADAEKWVREVLDWIEDIDAFGETTDN